MFSQKPYDFTGSFFISHMAVPHSPKPYKLFGRITFKCTIISNRFGEMYLVMASLLEYLAEAFSAYYGMCYCEQVDIPISKN